MRRAVSPLRGEVRPQKRFYPPRTRSPHLNLSQPPFKAWCADLVHPHFYSGWQFRLSPFAACPFAGSGPHVRRHSCFSPAVYGTRAGHPSVQHFSLHHPEQGCRGLSFTVEGAAASRPSRHPISGMSSLAQHSASSIALPSRMGASTGGIAVGSLHNSIRLHSSVWEKSPPLRRGSPDSSKQHLQGLCSTTGTFLPPTERSNRGSTAVGQGTRVLQPLLPRSKEGRRLEVYSGSTAFEFFPLQREVQDADDKNHHVSGPGGGLVCHHRPKGCVFSHQVVQRHRRFLRFAFGGKSYQYKVLPFGLALAPRTFTKCMDAALAPLRLQGIRVLNYLDDWLILAHSRELVSHHRDIVLGHIHSLGLRMNAKKSVFFPFQRTVFLGVHLDSVQMQARLAPARIPDLTACLAHFKLGQHVSVGICRRLLGLMAAASPVLPLGLLHMRPFLWWMKELRLHPTVPAFNVARPHFSPERGENGCDPPSPYDHDGRINDRLGSSLRRQTGERGVEGRVPLLAYRLPGTQGCLPGFEVFSPRPRGVSYHSQDGQYGGCVPHKPSRRFTVAHPGQACAPSSPLVPRQVPLFEGGSRSGNTEPCGRFSVETEAQAGGMDVEPSDGIPDLGSVWQSGGGPLCFSRVIPVPALVLPEFPDDSGHRCVRPPMAECQSVRVSANKADSGSTMQSEGERCPSPSHSPILALPDLVL